MAGEKNAPLDRVLSSSGRIRILTVLSAVEQLHLTEVAKRTDQSYSATERHLGDLSQAGIVEERDYGRVRVFKLNLTNERTKLLQGADLEMESQPRSRPRPSSSLNLPRLSLGLSQFEVGLIWTNVTNADA